MPAKGEAKPRTKPKRETKLFVAFPKGKRSERVAYKRNRFNDFRHLLDLPPDIIGKAKYKEADGTVVEKERKKPQRQTIVAHRLVKTLHYKRVSENRPITYPPVAKLKTALRELFGLAIKNRNDSLKSYVQDEIASGNEERLTPMDQPSPIDELPRVEESAFAAIKDGLNYYIRKFVSKVNVSLMASGRTVFKIQFLFTEIVKEIMVGRDPKIGDSILNAVGNIDPETPITYGTSTVKVDGFDIPVQQIYCGSGLDALLIKSNTSSSNESVKLAVNMIATIWLYYLASSTLFQMKEIGKKTLTADLTNIFIEEIVHQKVMCH